MHWNCSIFSGMCTYWLNTIELYWTTVAHRNTSWGGRYLRIRQRVFGWLTACWPPPSDCDQISEVSIVMGVPKMDGFQWKMPWKMPSINGWWLVVPQFQKPRNCQTSQEHRIWFELHTFSGHVMGSICTLFWNPWYLFTDLTSSIR